MASQICAKVSTPRWKVPFYAVPLASREEKHGREQPFFQKKRRQRVEHTQIRIGSSKKYFMNRLRSTLILLFACLASVGNAQQAMRLWYGTPAADWNAALPIGNGNLAAQIFGGVAVERLSLSEGMPSLTMGDLYLRFPDHTVYKGYTRDLNLSTAVASVNYTSKGVTYTREYYASLCDSVFVVRLKASKPKSITCNLSMSTPRQKDRIYDTDGMLVLSGISETNQQQSGKGRFITQVKPLLKNGRATIKDGVFSIDKADEATLYISMATNVVNNQNVSADEVSKCTRVLNRAYGKDFDLLKERHTAAFQQQFERVTLDLGSSQQGLKSTDQRIREFSKTNDPSLVALYYQYGHYRSICLSQPNAQLPFKMNGKYCGTSDISEMLLQNQDDFMVVLPALPDSWKMGSVKGLKARGGFEFDMVWKNKVVETLTIKSLFGGLCRIGSSVELVGKGLKKAKGDSPYLLYDLKMRKNEIMVLTRKI